MHKTAQQIRHRPRVRENLLVAAVVIGHGAPLSIGERGRYAAFAFYATTVHEKMYLWTPPDLQDKDSLFA